MMASPRGRGAPRTITIVILDPFAEPRRAIARLLGAQPEFVVLAAIEDLQAALEVVRRRRPRVTLVDLAALGEDGLRGLAHVRNASSTTRILVVGMHHDPALDREVARHGAAGRVLKDAPDTDLVAAVHVAARSPTRLRLVREDG